MRSIETGCRDSPRRNRAAGVRCHRTIPERGAPCSQSGADAGSHILFGPGPGLRGHGPFIAVARLQALPVGGDVGPELLGKSDVLGQPQGVADDDVGRGEPAGDERLHTGGRGFDRP